MKKVFSIFLFATSILWTELSTAQRYPECNDATVHERMVTKNNEAINKNYSLMLLHQTVMPTGTIFPVSISLESGIEHIINFIPSSKASRAKVTIIDKNKNVVVTERSTKNNGITLAFTPKYNGPYYILVTQKVHRGKNDCGAVSVLGRYEDDEQTKK